MISCLLLHRAPITASTNILSISPLRFTLRKSGIRVPALPQSLVSEVLFPKAASGWNNTQVFWVEEALQMLLGAVPSEQTSLSIPSLCAARADLSFTFLPGQWLRC